jgi:hypothetical protein
MNPQLIAAATYLKDRMGEGSTKASIAVIASAFGHSNSGTLVGAIADVATLLFAVAAIATNDSKKDE